MDSLSDTAHVVTNDFVSEGKSSIGEESQVTSSQNSSGENRPYTRVKSKKRRFHKNSKSELTAPTDGEERRNSDAILPAILRQISRRSPRIFRKSPTSGETEAMILANPLVEASSDGSKPKSAKTSSGQTESEATSPLQAEAAAYSRSTTANRLGVAGGELLTSPDDCLGRTYENAAVGTPTDSQHTVKFALMVHEMSETPTKETELKTSEATSVQPPADDKALSVRIRTNSPLAEEATETKGREDSDSSQKKSRSSLKSTESEKQSFKSVRNGIASKIAKKTLKHEQSLKRKVCF
ncbi:hypothetical protein ANCCAN_20357 [Ancylostoma caninum]|uniref:Uncharacterized protein n=1 Tax=Ancylostoma caninum TaxID=29170 RepID=A0A368FNJ9_ANCCA|nr:hypothetical protein ANCCAN_20357 [Ancylostoma caninum]